MDNEDALYYLMELEDDTLCSIIREWETYKGNPMARQAWEVIPASLLVGEWLYNQKYGNTHEEIIHKIQSIVIKNYIKLEINTVLFGHTSSRPYSFAERAISEDMSEEKFDEFLEEFENFACDENETWRISDYGLDKIGSYVLQLLETDDSNKKLYLIDAVLNVAHQRSDLASWFVEGGSTTLGVLSTQ